MAEASLTSNGTTAESDIIAMKETLLAQQQLLQKLHAELDEEREASATATSEAVDMILRLQAEKAAVKMEAQQYERMAEEKLEHVETTLEIFEELMFQKDVEIASLENQLHAYKRKLVSLGCDPNLTESELEENNNNNTDEHQHQNPENNESVRRLHSLPPLPANKNNPRVVRKRQRSQSPHRTDMIQTIEMEKTEKKPLQQQQQQNTVVESSTTHETLDAYWEQIRKLDEKVKEISDYKEIEGKHRGSNLRGTRHRSCSLIYPRGRIKTMFSNSSDQVLDHHHHEVKQQNKEAAITDPSCSSVNVHDMFEVIQLGDDDNNGVNNKHGRNILENLRNADSDNILTKPDSEVVPPEEKGEGLLRYDSGKLMKILSSNLETKGYNSPIGNNNNNNKIADMLSRKMEGMSASLECNGEGEFHILSKRIEKLERERERERERGSSRREITHEGDGKEQLKLLKEILSQLKSIKEDIIVSSEAKKSPPKDDDDDDGLLDSVNVEPVSTIHLHTPIRFYPLP